MFLPLVVINNAAVNICKQVLMWTEVGSSLGYMLRSGIAGSFGNSMFNLLRSCQTVSQSSWAFLHSHQQYLRVPVPLHLLMFGFFFFFFNSSHPNGYEVEFPIAFF